MPDFKDTHFALLGFFDDVLTDGYKLTAITDTPCHLWCRMTKRPPREHNIPSPRRGTYLTGEMRFCFVVFWDIEQEEPGDTLTHTWHVRDWPYCEVRYFYFIGTIAGLSVVSETVYFHLHFAKYPPLCVLVFDEPWSDYIDISTLIIYEPWSYHGVLPPALVNIFTEPWTDYSPPPPTLTLIFTEPWTYYAEPPPVMVLIFTEPWSDYIALEEIFTEPWTDY